MPNKKKQIYILCSEVFYYNLLEELQQMRIREREGGATLLPGYTFQSLLDIVRSDKFGNYTVYESRGKSFFAETYGTWSRCWPLANKTMQAVLLGKTILICDESIIPAELSLDSMSKFVFNVRAIELRKDMSNDDRFIPTNAMIWVWNSDWFIKKDYTFEDFILSIIEEGDGFLMLSKNTQLLKVVSFKYLVNNILKI
jgi:hypothetical protein